MRARPPRRPRARRRSAAAAGEANEARPADAQHEYFQGETFLILVRDEQGRGSGADGRSPFYRALARALHRRGMRLDELCPQNDPVARRVLEEYGSIFVASERVTVPHRCVFESEGEVLSFQKEAGWSAATFASARTEQTEVVIELQPAAMEALLAARDEAAAQGLEVTARGGAEAGRRTFDDTVRLWDSRCHPALDHWCSRGRLSGDEADRLRGMGLNEQVEAVLALEDEGMFFSTDFTKSILLSVAAPGASQHLAMLAFDIFEFRDEQVRRILARHGWFQTVVSDLPHFTFLGLEEEELPRRGLRRVRHAAQTFWIPDLGKGE